MLNDDILDILASIDHSSASSYQKISDFCQNLMKVEVANAIDKTPDSIQHVIEGVFQDFTDSMTNFCKMERYFMAHPSTWNAFYRTIKPPIDDALQQLFDITQKHRFQQSQKDIVEKSIIVIETLQDGESFFQKEASDVEDEANALRSKIEVLLREAHAIKHIIQSYPSLQSDASIQKRCQAIEENCRTIIQTCGNIYELSAPQNLHPPLSAAFVSTTQERLTGFNQHLRLDLSFLSDGEPDASEAQPPKTEDWYLERLNEYLPDIEENSKRGREVFHLLLQGIQQEFDKALETLQQIAAQSPSKDDEYLQDEMMYHLLDEFSLFDLSKKEFKQQIHLVSKAFEDATNQVITHHKNYKAHMD